MAAMALVLILWLCSCSNIYNKVYKEMNHNLLSCFHSAISIFIIMLSFKNKVLVRVQCHDAIITNEINLFGLARVEDSKEIKKFSSS